MKLKKSSVRLTIAFSAEQADGITKLGEHLDIDQGRSIRWIMDTCIEVSKKRDEIPEFTKVLSPRSIYLLDTLSKIKF